MSEARPERVSRMLHASGAQAWEAATRHPMVVAIGDGSLPHEVFLGYFAQNILYLQDYARAIALVLAKAPDRAGIFTLTGFLRQIVDVELPANVAFLERLGGDPASVVGAEAMLPTTYAYTRHLLSTCAQGSCAEGLTAVLPCQWSYGELARALVADPPDDAIYADWIAMFGSEDYDGGVSATTALLDRLADPEDREQMSTLGGIFERSTHYEVAFWDMAYEGPQQG